MHDKEPPRISLAQLPTPVVELKNLTRQIGVPRILVKRDDLTGLEASGNKIRKLEYVVAEAVKQGADTLITLGGVQSNHCRATAAIAARLGLSARLLLRYDNLNPPLDGNLFLDHLLGAEVTYHSPADFSEGHQQLVQEAEQQVRAAGGTPYSFPVGASMPLGCWGYVRCVSELVQQLGRHSSVDLFCATGSGGTQVGLMIGKALLKCDDWKVIGVPISDSADYFRSELRKLERATVEKFGLNLTEEDTPIHLIDGFVGQGYAIPYPEAIETIQLVARREGLLLDPSYTGKAMTGMLSTIRSGEVRAGAVPVFLHSGGVFGLMARRDLFSA